MCGVRALTLCLCVYVLCFDTVFVCVGPAWLLHGLSPRGSASARYFPGGSALARGLSFPVRLLHALSLARPASARNLPLVSALARGIPPALVLYIENASV